MAEELTREEQLKAAAEQQKKAREDAIRKLIAADDFDESHYKRVGIQDLIFARNAAKAASDKVTEEGKTDEFIIRKAEFLARLCNNRIAEHQELLKSNTFREADYAAIHIQDLAALASAAKHAREEAAKKEEPDENFIKFATAKEQFYNIMISKKTMEAQNASILVANDFDETHYEKLAIQQLMMLKNSATGTVAKQSANEKADPKLVEFFKKREEFFHFLIMKRLPEVDTIWCAYTQQTQMPFLTCSDETGNDQAWIYTAENIAKISLDRTLKKMEYPYEIKAIEKKDFITFYVSLLAMGVNEVIVDPGAASFAFDLEKFIKKPDFSKTVINQPLLLTGIYFSQQQRYGEQYRNDEKLAELLEEVKADIVRGDLLLSGIVPEGEEKPAVTELKYPIVQGKEGEKYQLIFTDFNEIVKYATLTKQTFQPVPIKGSALLQGIGQANKNGEELKGLIINPASLAIPLQIR